MRGSQTFFCKWFISGTVITMFTIITLSKEFLYVVLKFDGKSRKSTSNPTHVQLVHSSLALHYPWFENIPIQFTMAHHNRKLPLPPPSKPRSHIYVYIFWCCHAHDVGFHVVWKHSNPHHSCPSPIENFPRHHLLIQEHLSMYKYSDIAMHMMLVFMFNSSLPCINYVVMIPCRAQINQILVPLKAAGVVANVAMWIIPFELSATARIVEMRGQILAIR